MTIRGSPTASRSSGNAGDPVDLGLVRNLKRPGGNLTEIGGLIDVSPEHSVRMGVRGGPGRTQSRWGDGHDFPGLVDEGVPGVAAVIDDVVEGLEDAV
jgi:hypothetical protein